MARANLANNRKSGDTKPTDPLKTALKLDIYRNPAKYKKNLDVVSFANSGLDVTKESFYLSQIVRKIELDDLDLDQLRIVDVDGGAEQEQKERVLPCRCCRRVMPDKLAAKIFDGEVLGGVQIVSDNGNFRFKGLMQCKNVWRCPICARTSSEKRKIGLQRLLSAHIEQYGTDTITASLFTFPHSATDDLEDIKTRFVAAYNAFTRSRGYKELVKCYGLRGSSRAFEVTYSVKNGFHPHFHVLHFFDTSLLNSIDYIKQRFFSLWQTACLSLDFDYPSLDAFGCHLIASDDKTVDDVAAYFSKTESDTTIDDISTYLQLKRDTVRSVDGSLQKWGVEHELTKWHLKKSTGHKIYRYSMFDLLRGYAINDLSGNDVQRDKFAQLWKAYAMAFSGQRQLFTRHKDFKLADLMLDDVVDFDQTEQLTDEQQQQNQTITIPFNDWMIICYFRARGLILSYAKRGGSSAVDDILSQLREKYNPPVVTLEQSLQVLDRHYPSVPIGLYIPPPLLDYADFN